MITSIENFVTRRAAAPVPGFLQPETTTEAARLSSVGAWRRPPAPEPELLDQLKFSGRPGGAEGLKLAVTGGRLGTLHSHRVGVGVSNPPPWP